jgi:hypothetical protein
VAGQGVGQWRKLRLYLWAFFVTVLTGLTEAPVCPGEEPLASEYQIKAAFIINFPKYADWPPEAFAAATSPIVFAVVGESKVTDELQKLIPGRKINGREMILKRLPSGELPVDCHILFIPATELRRSPNLLSKFNGVGVLTVGESDDFLAGGGCINLARKDQKIALEVSLEAVDQSRVKISSKLLSLARVVKRKAN